CGSAADRGGEPAPSAASRDRRLLLRRCRPAGGGPMTTPRIRTARGRIVAVRWGGALTACLAFAGLVAIGLPGAAPAAPPNDTYNKMTGAGATASAITVPWTKGLLDSNNQPITTPNPPVNTPGYELSPNSDRGAFAAGTPASTFPLGFMYDDFKNLQVTVSQ